MVCPNCNNNLPDGSIACNFCGFAINAYAVQRNTQQLYAQNAPQHQQAPQMRQPMQYQPQQFYQVPNQPVKTCYITGLILGIIAGLLILLSTFMPYVTAEVWGFKQSASIYQISPYYLIEAAVLCLGLIIDSIIKHGKSNIAVGIILLIICIYRYVNYQNFITESEYSMTQLGVGYYMVAVAAVTAIASGILINIHNREGI